ADGSIATIESSASLLKDATGTPVGFFGISRDISEKRKAENELEQYRRDLEQMVQERTKALEEAQGELIKREKLATLGQLTSTVSHELRNPLGVIRSSNFYLQRKIETRDEKIDKHFQRIEDQVALCDNIVTDLLEYTQGRSVSVKKAPMHLWLEKLIGEIEETRSITIERRLPDDLPAIAHDREKMRRVFINLIENALQAIKDCDEPNKTPREGYRPAIRVTARREANQLVVAVADNGVGMNEKTRRMAFEPLFTTRARGTGIGLAIVQKIVNEHGGNVSLQSEPDKGTTITITLPCG
ncbi:MAG: GHKL domain-containing protein, partial [Desulfobacterales bacterium]|nr:GHKL domain-containing protein [Desulfobacterales bacterium]